MDSTTNRVEGTATNFGGKIEQGFGELTGDTKTQGEGRFDQIKGQTQDVFGQAQGAVKGAWDKVPGGVKDAAAKASDTARDALGRAGDAARSAYDRAPDGLKQGVDKAGAAAKRNPLITIALIGVAASAISHLLGVGSRDRAGYRDRT